MAAIAVTGAVHLFGLSVSGGIALYFIIWWTSLFAVLPFGVRSQAEVGDVATGTEPGAPAVPALREKALWTTLAASAILLIVAGLLPLSGL
jgi:predicted secreted protein